MADHSYTRRATQRMCFAHDVVDKFALGSCSRQALRMYGKHNNAVFAPSPMSSLYFMSPSLATILGCRICYCTFTTQHDRLVFNSSADNAAQYTTTRRHCASLTQSPSPLGEVPSLGRPHTAQTSPSALSVSNSPHPGNASAEDCRRASRKTNRLIAPLASLLTAWGQACAPWVLLFNRATRERCKRSKTEGILVRAFLTYVAPRWSL